MINFDTKKQKIKGKEIMSLDKIQLPAFTHQSMFKNKLVNSSTTSTQKFVSNELRIDFLGDNKKKFVFIAEDISSRFLTDDNLKFLQGLLSACRLTVDDISFINITHNKLITYCEVTAQLAASKLLLFGVPAQALDLPFQIPFFQVQNFREQQYMLSPSFETLKNDSNLKKQLWLCLQKIFNIQK